MHQIKIFIGKEDETQRLTKDVNDFLASSKAKVVNVFGNLAPQTPTPNAEAQRAVDSLSRRYAPSDIMLVVVYEA